MKSGITVVLACSLKIAPTQNDLQLFLMTEADKKKIEQEKKDSQTNRYMDR